MMNFKIKKLPYPGLRNIKTGVSVMFCLLLYEFLGRDGVILAAIASLICMQDSVEKSIREGFHRVIGTVVGGIFATLFAYLNLPQNNYILWLSSLVFGIIFLIYISNLLNIKHSIIIGCVVYLIIVIEPENTDPILYSISRVLDTIMGIVIAVSVNRFLFRPKQERYKNKIQGAAKMQLNYELKKAHQYKNSSWSGGTTTEIYIYPKNALYSERDFDFRISSASVILEQSDFSKLNGYMRHIMVLKGAMRLIHRGQHTVALEQFDQDYFNGEWNTTSYGQCTDFNLILKEGIKGSLECLQLQQEHEFTNKSITAFYFLRDNIKIIVKHNNEEVIVETLNKKDFIIFNPFDQKENYEFNASFTNNNLENHKAVAIAVNIYENMEAINNEL